MAETVNKSPNLPSHGAESLFQKDLIRALIYELSAHARRLNDTLTLDGSTIMRGPLRMQPIAEGDVVAAYPPADYAHSLIMVDGKGPAYSDGTDWWKLYDPWDEIT